MHLVVGITIQCLSYLWLINNQSCQLLREKNAEKEVIRERARVFGTQKYGQIFLTNISKR